MTSIVAFPRGHIEISNGIVTAESMQDAEGVRSITDGLGRMAYLVESVDEDGGCLCLWDCRSYGEAIDRANQLRHEGWGTIVDRVTE